VEATILMLDSTELIRELVALPGPPGREEAVCEAVRARVRELGYECRADAKGNLIVPMPSARAGQKTRRRPARGEGLAERLSQGDPTPSPSPRGRGSGGGGARVVVTAHMDEIALIVTNVHPDGTVSVAPLGGLYPWKWGEQPVEILTRDDPVPGILSFGCIHTSSPVSTVQQARVSPLTWDQCFVFTGMTKGRMTDRGVRPGVRVTLASDRRTVREIGPFLASYFLDDRADLAAWLLALESLRSETFATEVLFAATVAEEVEGEGASYLFHRLQPDVCIALEIGPSVPESSFLPDSQPTVWVNDSFAAMAAHDLERVAEVCEELGLRPHWQALSRGGSDATCTAQRGLTARPVTFGLPVENSHGFEIMHRDAPVELARLTGAFVRRLDAD
jgi:putative aminopeptidase FrvX